MVQSRDITVNYIVEGISYMGLSAYGKIMIEGRALEFYNNRNVKDYVRIPWDEVDTIVASVSFKGREISCFAVVTKSSGTLSFSPCDNKALLRTAADYVDKEQVVRSLSFLNVIKRSIRRIVHREKEDQTSC